MGAYFAKHTEIDAGGDSKKDFATYTDDEVVDYSKEGGVYNPIAGRWEWRCVAGVFHRDGGKPAWIYDNGTMVWFYYGRRHRLDGPAWYSMTPFVGDRWFIHGKPYDTEEDFEVARDEYYDTNGAPEGHLTKRAVPNV